MVCSWMHLFELVEFELIRQLREWETYQGKMLRDLKVENGGAAPCICSLDDTLWLELSYYILLDPPKLWCLILFFIFIFSMYAVQVEKVDASKSSGTVIHKRPVMKKVMKCC